MTTANEKVTIAGITFKPTKRKGVRVGVSAPTLSKIIKTGRMRFETLAGEPVTFAETHEMYYRDHATIQADGSIIVESIRTGCTAAPLRMVEA